MNLLLFFSWVNNKKRYFCTPFAGVVKLVDTLDLGSSASRHGGSSPFTRTKVEERSSAFFVKIRTISSLFFCSGTT